MMLSSLKEERGIFGASGLWFFLDKYTYLARGWKVARPDACERGSQLRPLVPCSDLRDPGKRGSKSLVIWRRILECNSSSCSLRRYIETTSAEDDCIDGDINGGDVMPELRIKQPKGHKS
jgi:hypothetical protein